MDVIETPLPGVLVLRPRVFRDDRGSLVESWRLDRYAGAGLPTELVQDNVVVSKAGVLRGLHYQWPEPQGKLIMAVRGEVFDVAVDIRRGSPTFGAWYGHRLSGETGEQLWVPEGFAHGYTVLSEGAVVTYKCTRVYQPGMEGAVRWDDPGIGIDWPVSDPVLSQKDRDAPLLRDVDSGQLPDLDDAREPS